MRNSFIVEDPPLNHEMGDDIRDKEVRAKNDHILSSATKISPGLTLITTSKLGPKPCVLTCPTCHTQVVTDTKPTTGLLTWMLSLPLCFLCPFIGFSYLCGILPFCISDFHDMQHYCPFCSSYVGTYVRWK